MAFTCSLLQVTVHWVGDIPDLVVTATLPNDDAQATDPFDPLVTNLHRRVFVCCDYHHFVKRMAFETHLRWRAVRRRHGATRRDDSGAGVSCRPVDSGKRATVGDNADASIAL